MDNFPHSFFLIRNYLFIRRGEYERLRPDESDGLDGDPAGSELEARPTEASAAEESVRDGTDPEVFLLLRPRRLQSSQISLFLHYIFYFSAICFA